MTDPTPQENLRNMLTVLLWNGRADGERVSFAKADVDMMRERAVAALQQVEASP